MTALVYNLVTNSQKGLDFLGLKCVSSTFYKIKKIERVREGRKEKKP